MANDGKYKRLYPERAVAPLRDYARILVRQMQDQGEPDDGLTDALELLETQGFPEDEPLLLLRGQDVLAADTVRFYADAVRRAGAFGGAAENVAAIGDLEAHADRMATWIPRRLPD